jgi:multiple sugar transport system substrate-binding protein
MQWKSPGTRLLFSLALLGLAGGGGLVFLLALSGCGGPPDSAAPPPPTFGRVRVACPPEVGRAVVKTYARGWEGQTSGEVVVVPYDQRAGGRPDVDARVVPRPGGRPPDADVWVLPAAELPRWAAAGELQPLSDSFATAEDYNWRSLLPLYREHTAVWNGKRYGVPLVGEALLCCYRKDWFDDPKHREAFEKKHGRKLAPPATWEQFADIAEYFAEANEGPSLPPLPPLVLDDDALETEFYTIAANYAVRAVPEGEKNDDDRLLFSFQYESTTGEPRIATGGFVHALKLMTRLQKFRPPGTSDDPAAAFAEGHAVFCLVTPARLAAFQKHLDLPKVVGVCPVPGAGGYYDFDRPDRWVARDNNRVPYIGGGWLGVVPKGSTDEKAALSLLAYLSSPEVSRQIVIDPEVGGRPIRQEHLDGSTRWDTFGLSAEQTAKMRDALKQTLEHPGLRNPARRLRTPDEAAHRRALDEELREALRGDKSPEKALKDAAARWAQLDGDRGLAKHRAEYRISVGLRPKE